MGMETQHASEGKHRGKALTPCVSGTGGKDTALQHLQKPGTGSTVSGDSGVLMTSVRKLH